MTYDFRDVAAHNRNTTVQREFCRLHRYGDERVEFSLPLKKAERTSGLPAMKKANRSWLDQINAASAFSPR
jgi:hypothetical protein